MEKAARVPGKSPRRTPEAVNALWKAHRGGDPAARNSLLEEHLFIVDGAAFRLKERMPHSIQVEDLRAAGFFGLLDAVEKFDPSRGVKFPTYCAKRVHGAMIDFLRDMDHVPRLMRSRVNQMEKAHVDLERRLNRTPGDLDLARELGISVEQLDGRMFEARHAFSTPMRRRSLEKDPLLLAPELVRDPGAAAPADAAARRDLLETVRDRLSAIEWWTLLMHHLDGFTLREIGVAFALSESRMCQLEARALAKVRLRHGGKETA
jgi:RNA polymerase sigma factor for flagellar operon FliA